jgi:hypothetical protein
MTPTSTRAGALITAVAVVVAVLPGTAHGALLPPAAPWPAPVANATNPLIGTPFAFNGADATPNATLDVWLPVGTWRRAQVTRAFGARTVIRGRLQNLDNHRPIRAATVQLAANNVNDGGDWYLAGSARSDRKGVFRGVLPAGPTRRVAALYWPGLSATLPLFSAALLVRTSASVSLRTAMLTGRRIVYRGRVSGAPIPPGGLLVAVQVRNGASWVTVGLVRTAASGRFIARYRFKYRGRRFAVRARVPSQPAWSLYTGQSQTTTVRSR